MRSIVLLVPLAAALGLVGIVGAVSAGCSQSSDDAPGAVDSSVYEAESDSKVQGIEVHDDASGHPDYCGEMRLCDPDVPAVCMVLVTDSGLSDGDDAALDSESTDSSADAASADASDGGSDTGSGTTAACRVVHKGNAIVAACAPAGRSTTFCASDDDCAPGLACVGPKSEGRCLRYCCAAYQDPLLAADAGAGNYYCALQPLAAGTTSADKVPVWVKLDNCTLLDDSLQCAEGSTCTVVTNDGRTTCVPIGSGRDYASCAEEACDRGYVCLGSVDRRCRKLCSEAEGASACAGGAYCQKTPTIPEGFGICAGGDAG